MARLTKIDGIGQHDLIRCFGCDLERAGENLEHCGYCEEGWQRAVNRLAAYEETGLEPEDIKKEFNEETVLKLAAQVLGTTPERLRDEDKARDEGRVVVDKKTALAMAAGARAIENNKRLWGVTYGWDIFGECGGPKEISYYEAAQRLREISEPELTRAEAEAALSSQEGGPHEADSV